MKYRYTFGPRDNMPHQRIIRRYNWFLFVSLMRDVYLLLTVLFVLVGAAVMLRTH